MKLFFLYIFLFLLGATPGSAQKYVNLQAHFSKFVKDSTDSSKVDQPFKLKHVDYYRERIWKDWKKAHATLEEEKLVPLCSLSDSTRGKWHIPGNLEPHAVLPYFYGSKGTCPNEGYPLFLYLHGSGPKDAEWTTGLKLALLFDDGPSAYFVPQIPNEGAYYRWYLRSKQYVIEKLLREVFLKDNVNPNRLYVFGISEGGYGSQRIASFYADYLAAAGPMAGGEPLKNAPVENCRHIGFSLLTGAQDKGFYRDILTGYTKEAFDSLQHLEPQDYVHRIQLIPGKAHAIDYRPTTPWLKQFVRNPWPKHFSWEDFEMDGRHRSGFYNLVVIERPDQHLRTRYDVDIHDNVIEISVQNVTYTTVEKDKQWGIEMKFSKKYEPVSKGEFLIYLDEHLVDLSKKVKVVVNGKNYYHGKVVCNLKNMVNSLQTFYDSQRIYPAVVSVKIEE